MTKWFGKLTINPVRLKIEAMSARLRSKERETASTATTSFTNQFVYIEYEIDSANDTLQTLSIRFAVSISDLKRFNSIQNDRDIYALKFVKIPIRPNSYQSELYASQLKYSDTILTRLTNGDFEPLVLTDVESVNGDEISSQEPNSDTNDDQESARLLADSRPSRQAKEARNYFKKLDNKLESLITQNQEIISEVKNKHGAEAERLVPISNISYSVESRSRNLTNKNSFFNFSVREILIIALLFVIIIPLVISIYRLIYISDNEKKYP